MERPPVYREWSFWVFAVACFGIVLCGVLGCGPMPPAWRAERASPAWPGRECPPRSRCVPATVPLDDARRMAERELLRP